MLICSSPPACFEHSNFLTVNDGLWRPQPKVGGGCSSEAVKLAHPPLTSNYELFNCSNVAAAYWSWNYRGCWHQTCPPVDSQWSLHKAQSKCVARRPRLGNELAISQLLEGIIYTPAATRMYGRRLSGDLSGIEPSFPATRYRPDRALSCLQADR